MRQRYENLAQLCHEHLLSQLDLFLHLLQITLNKIGEDEDEDGENAEYEEDDEAITVQAQTQQKRSSRITSSRSFGTNVKASASNGVNFVCPEEFGYYPHPSDCTQYYVCVFGGALLESCTGGLMYSHELQTCDWPCNVVCEVVDNSAASLGSTGSGSGTRSGNQQQQQQSINSQQVPSRIRFGSAFSSPAGTTQSPKATVPPQYHRQPPQVIQAQVQSLPQHAGTVIGTRRQPKPFDTQDDIAKVSGWTENDLADVELGSDETTTHKRVKRDLSVPNNEDTKIVYNIGEILKTDKNPKTLGKTRALHYNTGEILKTEEHQRTLDKPKIATYLNTDEIQTTTTGDVRPFPSTKELGYAMAKENTEQKGVVLYNGNTTVQNTQVEPAQAFVETDKNMQESIMEIVDQILEELKGAGGQPEKSTDGAQEQLEQADSATSSETTVSSKRIDELNTEKGREMHNTAGDPIMETLNNIAALLDMDYDTDAANDSTAVEARMRGTRQLRQYFSGRARYQIQNVPGTHYRSIDADGGPYQQQQSSISFGAYNPYLSPPSTSANYNQLSPGYQVYPQQQQLQRPQTFGGGGLQKHKFTYTAALNPPPPPATAPLIEDDFRPMAANYYRTTTTLRPSTTARRPNLFNNPELIPYILQSLREYQEQRKKMQQQNFQYFHLENGDSDAAMLPQMPHYQSTKTPLKVTSNTHFSQFSTVGGFYNNQHSSQEEVSGDYKPTVKYPSKLVSQYSIVDNYIPTTTESNYFKYNLLANQKIKGAYHSTPVPRYTTQAPSTSNINIISASNLTPSHVTTTTTKFPKYNSFEKYPQSLAFSNNSAQFPQSYQVFTKVRTSTISPKLKISHPTSSTVTTANTPQSSRKPALTLQFNVPEFVASLQSSDLANMSPQVVNMIKYFKQLNAPQPGRKPVATSTKTSQPNKHVEQYDEQIEATTEENRQRPTVTPTKRPVKGYEDFLKSIPNQSHKFNAHNIHQGRPFSTTTSSTIAPDYYDEYGEEEDEPLGTDTDDDIMPPSQMPPYMPMSETMAPPRPQFMPAATPTPTKSTPASAQHAKPNFQTGFFEATTTRGPFGGAFHFHQFYQTTASTQGTKQHNQIPSFINFPSDIFQDIKQRLPPRPQLGSTVPTLTNNINNNVRFTITRTTTTPAPRTTTTRAPSTTSTMTTTTTQRTRYTVRPSIRHSKWQTSDSSNKELNNVEHGSNYNSNSKGNKTDFGAQSFRKRPAATPASSALGSVQLNVNMHLDVADSGQR
ncbi:uncharacterized protein LOC118741840 [Rhagoletis pomonella]|uniref:uncharacterized protein LOC118741840 n=1 Tax=Rhagoletis pomonella TaxID=28610 RepID=UPI00177C7BD3|nr:uncharacterized protein LOC118741840 [Rhagoletis pomonella]